MGSVPRRIPALPGYAELHCRSNFSFLTGASHPAELVERAQALRYSALAITDECSLAGVVRAHVAARESGMHLIIATQYPTRDMIDGALRANLRAKVALRVKSTIESRIVLGVGGAEGLLGQGDLLYQDASGPVRLQAPLLSPADRKELFSSDAVPQ